MNSFKRLSLLAFFLSISQFSEAASGDTFQGSSKVVSLNKTFTVEDNTAVPETWLELTTVSMNTPSSSSSIYIAGSTTAGICSSYFCTGGEISLGNTGQAKYIVYLTRYPVTITDNAGNQYVFSVSFPNGMPVVYASDFNHASNKYWHKALSMSASGDFTSPSSSQSALGVTTNAQGYCGSISGCLWRSAFWMSSAGGAPVISIKLPKNLSSQTITFNEQTLLSLSGYLGNKSNPLSITIPTISLKISGSITIPERCFLSVDKNSFDFGNIYTNAENGEQGNVTANVTTTCNYAPDGTQQYITMTAVSGGNLNASKNYYEIGNESSTNEALGIIFKVNDRPDCESKGDKFNSEQLINSFTYGWSQSKTTPIYFSLCKYGIPSRTGAQNIALKLTSRWVIN
ncbi:TPA: hypothetical protein O8U71_004782 [Escherichia coli]|nr:hypothetical protein [Escherichia coli]